MAAFFEGAEKKVELVVKPGSASLREISRGVWDEVVRGAGATILHEDRTDHCDAYLLSESSLFVFEDYLVMITCGRTRLADAIDTLLRWIPRESVALLVYERKNELFPWHQATTFYEDARRLHELFPGEAVRFGGEHGGGVHMFYTTQPHEHVNEDSTVEILMHGIDEHIASRFCTARLSEGPVASTTGFPFDLDEYRCTEHVFDPPGYSMNGLRGEEYVTLHVTPGANSYASFETNLDFGRSLTDLVSGVVNVFQPRAFEVVSFVSRQHDEVVVAGYQRLDWITHSVGGYGVQYAQFGKAPHRSRNPNSIPLT